jgi:hypothetical protein
MPRGAPLRGHAHAADRTANLITRFAAFAWPVAVDFKTGANWSHNRSVVIGGLYAGWMRQQLNLVVGSGSIKGATSL